MLQITSQLNIPDNEIKCEAIRAQGAGGQNVNKVSSAIHLRFDVQRSSLPEEYKEKLLTLNDRRITKGGIIVLKAQQFRTQKKNRQDAHNRLKTLILKSTVEQKERKTCQIPESAETKRLVRKKMHGKLKALREKVFKSDW